MPRPGFYILRGHRPVLATVAESVGALSDSNARKVARTRVRKGRNVCDVSTVFLCLDHGHSLDGPPILFETMVFGGPMNDWQRRYATWDEAMAGHRETVALVRKALKKGKPKESDPVVQKYEPRTWHQHLLDDKD
jgi:hypothetical protein